MCALSWQLMSSAIKGGLCCVMAMVRVQSILVVNAHSLVTPIVVIMVSVVMVSMVMYPGPMMNAHVCWRLRLRYQIRKVFFK